MSERRDNTTEGDESSPLKNERRPSSYYYDDATGYEIYDPSKEDEGEDDEPADEKDEAGR